MNASAPLILAIAFVGSAMFFLACWALGEAGGFLFDGLTTLREKIADGYWRSRHDRSK